MASRLVRHFFPLALIALAADCQLDMTNLIYDKFGFSDGEILQLSPSNITELVKQVLNGKYYIETVNHGAVKDAPLTSVSSLITTGVHYQQFKIAEVLPHHYFIFKMGY